MIQKTRCDWCHADPLLLVYHDIEWGVPLFDDKKLFEFLILESMQAGLNWLTILKKRENFRAAFDQFNPEKIAAYSDKKITTLMNDAGIIRNRLKILAAVNNAQRFIEVVECYGSFKAFIWDFVGGKPVQNTWKAHANIPASTTVSDDMSRVLKKLGFKFVGSTICYAHMQATGMVNDHLLGCFRHQEVQTVKTTFK